MFYKQFILDNGVKTVYISKRDLNISCINVLFKVGAKNESKEHLGISHVLEHMLLKGTKQYGTNQEITSQIEALGGYINAHTTRDTTFYIIKINTKYLQKAIDILSDILLHSLFRKKDLEYEKNVVIEELMGGLDNPDHVAYDEFSKSIFEGVPLQQDPIGTIDTIRAITRSSLINYMKKFYTSDNMHITISSNLSFKRIEHMIRNSSFKSFAPTDLKKHMPFTYIPNDQATVQVVYKSIEQEKMYIGFPICSATHEDRYVIDLIAAILTGGMSSRLFIALRETNPLVYYVKAQTEYYQDMGIFYIKTAAKLENILDVDTSPLSHAGSFIQSLFGKQQQQHRKGNKGIISIILDHIRKIKKNTLNKPELSAVKQYIIGAGLLNSEESKTVVEYYKEESVYNYDNIKSIHQLSKIYEKIKASDIVRVCNTYFSKDKMFVTILGQSSESRVCQCVEEYMDF